MPEKRVDFVLELISCVDLDDSDEVYSFGSGQKTSSKSSEVFKFQKSVFALLL